MSIFKETRETIKKVLIKEMISIEQEIKQEKKGKNRESVIEFLRDCWRKRRQRIINLLNGGKISEKSFDVASYFMGEVRASQCFVNVFVSLEGSLAWSRVTGIRQHNLLGDIA